MAGKMSGMKGMAASKMKEKAPPPPSKGPHKNPRSAHIREANGGYIMSAGGGDDMGMGADHVAPDLDSMIERMRGHMSPAEIAAAVEGGGMPPEAMAEEAPPPKKKPAAKAKKKGKKAKIKLRDKSETY